MMTRKGKSAAGLPRRTFIGLSLATASAGLALAGGLAWRRAGAAGADAGTDDFDITLSEAQWRARLTPAQFAILREHATERAFSNSLMGEHSPLLHEDRPGTYHCAGCDNALYRSETKYDSGTGWPSYWQEIEGAVGFSTDTRFFMRRTEVHCARCGGHLGHVFEDGPEPTGLRHCINGLAMTFQPD